MNHENHPIDETSPPSSSSMMPSSSTYPSLVHLPSVPALADLPMSGVASPAVSVAVTGESIADTDLASDQTIMRQQQSTPHQQASPNDPTLPPHSVPSNSEVTDLPRQQQVDCEIIVDPSSLAHPHSTTMMTDLNPSTQPVPIHSSAHYSYSHAPVYDLDHDVEVVHVHMDDEHNEPPVLVVVQHDGTEVAQPIVDIPMVSINTISIHNKPHAQVQPIQNYLLTNTTNTTLLASPTQTGASGRPKYWHRLPFELHSHIATFLDVRHLILLSQTNSMNRTICNRKDLWTPLCQQPRSDYRGLGIVNNELNGLTPSQGKAFFVARHQLALKRRLDRIAEWERERRRARIARHGCVWDTFTDPCLYFLATAAMTLFVIFLVYQLQKAQAVDFFTFWPILFLIGLFIVCSVFLCALKWTNRYYYLPHSFYSDSESPLKGLIELLGDGVYKRAHASWCLAMIGIALFFIFLILRITDHIGWPWPAVFAPLFLTFLLGCCAPCFRWLPEEDYDSEFCFGFIQLFVAIPLLTFVILLCVRLSDPSTMGLTFVFIPLFLFDAGLFGLCVYLTYSNSWSEGLWYFLTWFCLDGPLLVFKILLALRVDRDMESLSYAIIFVPLYFLQLLILCAGFGMCVARLNNSEQEWADMPKRPNEPIPRVL